MTMTRDETLELARAWELPGRGDWSKREAVEGVHAEAVRRLGVLLQGGDAARELVEAEQLSAEELVAILNEILGELEETATADGYALGDEIAQVIPGALERHGLGPGAGPREPDGPRGPRIIDRSEVAPPEAWPAMSGDGQHTPTSHTYDGPAGELTHVLVSLGALAYATPVHVRAGVKTVRITPDHEDAAVMVRGEPHRARAYRLDAPIPVHRGTAVTLTIANSSGRRCRHACALIVR
jgi:hypothetical protein